MLTFENITFYLKWKRRFIWMLIIQEAWISVNTEKQEECDVTIERKNNMPCSNSYKWQGYTGYIIFLRFSKEFTFMEVILLSYVVMYILKFHISIVAQFFKNTKPNFEVYR